MDPLLPHAGEVVIVCADRPRRASRRALRGDRRARRANLEIERLRVACCCRSCKLRKKWPAHYMGVACAAVDRAMAVMAVGGRQKAEGRRMPAAMLISFECNIEGEEIDPDLEEELRLLRNEPVRYGAIWVGTQARVRRD